MKPIQHLKQLHIAKQREKYPNVPEYCIIPYDYKDKKANGLTRCIIDWIKFNGGQAERINTMGRPIDKRKTVTDVCGFRKQIGSLEWGKSTATRGSADISAIYPVFINGVKVGLSFKIEVKIGKDVQSKYQIEYQKKVEEAGAYYLLVSSFDDFYFKFNAIIKK